MERCVCLRGSRKQREAGRERGGRQETSEMPMCCPGWSKAGAPGGQRLWAPHRAWGWRLGRAASQREGHGEWSGLQIQEQRGRGAVDSEHALAWTGRQMPPASLALSPLSPYSSVPEGQVPAHGRSLNGHDRALPLWASCLLPSPGAQVPASLYSALQRGQHGRLILGQRWGAVQSFQAPFTHGQIKEPDTATAQPSPGAPQPLGVKGANYR